MSKSLNSQGETTKKLVAIKRVCSILKQRGHKQDFLCLGIVGVQPDGRNPRGKLAPFQIFPIACFCIGQKLRSGDFPGLLFSGSPVVKNPPCSAGNTSSIPGLERSHMPQGK